MTSATTPDGAEDEFDLDEPLALNAEPTLDTEQWLAYGRARRSDADEYCVVCSDTIPMGTLHRFVGIRGGLDGYFSHINCVHGEMEPPTGMFSTGLESEAVASPDSEVAAEGLFGVFEPPAEATTKDKTIDKEIGRAHV